MNKITEFPIIPFDSKWVLSIFVEFIAELSSSTKIVEDQLAGYIPKK